MTDTYPSVIGAQELWEQYVEILESTGIVPSAVLLTRHEYGHLKREHGDDSSIFSYWQAGVNSIFGVQVIFVCYPVKNMSRFIQIFRQQEGNGD